MAVSSWEHGEVLPVVATRPRAEPPRVRRVLAPGVQLPEQIGRFRVDPDEQAIAELEILMSGK
jgi:hypothetical protein